MRSLSYRGKRRLKKTARTLLILAAFLVLLVILAVIYLGRYVVYTPDGAYLDFGRNTALQAATVGTEPSGPAPIESVRIEYADPNLNTETAEKVSGYYIDLEMLSDPEAVLEAVRNLSGPCTVMIDLKAKDGSFYDSTGIEDAQRADIEIAKVDRIISLLKNRGFTMVARVRSFQDSAFALAHLKCALPIDSGALWVGNGSYWLDPANETVVAYLKQIARDLAGKGFREIVFDDFYFPDSNYIRYTFDRTRSQIISDTANDLLNFFASSNITISFGNPRPDFALAKGSHVYVTDVTGSNVKTVFASYSALEEPAAQLVFLTGSKDKRFEDCQLLRPLLTKLVN